MRISTYSKESFSCFVKACAPPPVGRGGSTKEGIAAHKEAVKRYNAAKAVEPQVSKVLQSVAKQIGAVQVGLKFRLKEIKSLTRKIHDKAMARGLTMEQSGAAIGDSLRYTMVIHSKNYGPKIREALKEFEKAGFKIPAEEKETHWPKGDAYNGAHVQLIHPNGTKIEMQFHTTGSWRAKNLTHGMYEEARKPDTTPARRRELILKMIELADSVRRPTGAIASYLGKKVFRPPEGV